MDDVILSGVLIVYIRGWLMVYHGDAEFTWRTSQGICAPDGERHSSIYLRASNLFTLLACFDARIKVATEYPSLSRGCATGPNVPSHRRMVSILVSTPLTYRIRIIVPPFASEIITFLIDESGMASVALDAELGDTQAPNSLLMERMQPFRYVDTVTPLKLSDHGAINVSALTGVTVVNDAVDKKASNLYNFMIIS